MAKRVKEAEANRYRPVQQSLVAAAAAGGGGAGTVVPPRAVPETRTPVAVSDSEPRAKRVDEVLDPRQRLSREKRYLLTSEEEDVIESLVRRLAGELRTPLKLSQLIRASLQNIVRNEAELLSEARRASDRVVRPANGDGPGMRRYEAELARLLDSACRMSATQS